MKFYIISPPENNINFSPKNFDLISKIINVEYFQFRPKFSNIQKKISFVGKYFSEIKQICKKNKTKLIINDDFEIAKKFVFDGIHLGQYDKDCIEAKKKFGRKFHVGVSCGASIVSAKKAQNDGANYVAFGPAFKSKTKNKKKISLNNLIKKRMEISLPFTIIGGINHKNFVKLRELRPDYVAIINSLWNFKAGPIESAKLFKKLMFIGDLNHENQCKLT